MKCSHGFSSLSPELRNPKNEGQTPARRRTLGRCSVTMLYAHWEGFVKLAGRHFLEYVAMQRLFNRQLHPNLLTLSMRSTAGFPTGSKKASDYGRITAFFLSNMENRARINFKGEIDTESNLSSKVLQEIVWSLGIDYGPFETSEKFIDSRLLGRRNHIAHGEHCDVDPEEYDDMRTKVVYLMTSLKTQLENSAVLQAYKTT